MIRRAGTGGFTEFIFLKMKVRFRVPPTVQKFKVPLFQICRTINFRPRTVGQMHIFRLHGGLKLPKPGKQCPIV